MAEIILPAGTKMKMLSVALGTISLLDFAVLFVLFNEVDRATGCAEISHDRIAELVGCKRRAAERATRRLLDAKHIQIDRRQVGHRANGSNVFGGRGGKNRYRLIFERPSGETVKRKETSSHGTVIKDRPARHERPSGDDTKDRPAEHGTLSLNLSPKNPLRRAALARGANTWGAVKCRVSRSLGEDIFAAWFGKLVLADVSGSIVTLLAPSKFVANWIDGHYPLALQEAWQCEDRTISQVLIVDRSRLQTQASDAGEVDIQERGQCGATRP
jgi:hypothetical protein